MDDCDDRLDDMGRGGRGEGPPGDGAPGEDAAVERLLRAAGRRPAVPAERTGRVHDAVHLHWRYVVRSRRRLRRLSWLAAPLAAAAAWLLLAGPDLSRWIPRLASPAATVASLERSTGSLVWSGDAPLPGEEFGAGTMLQTGADGRAAVRLRAGISVRIDRGSAVRFDGVDALDLERGAVYVDTAGATSLYGGVAIATPFGVVRDVGTRFQMAVSADRLRLSVREGAAQIEHRGALHRAIAGVRLDVGEDGGVARSAVPPSGPEWDWVMELAPEFDLEGAALGRYLEWIGRETGLRVEFGDPSIAVDATGVILHGSIEGLRPDETLDIVLPTCGLRHRSEGGALIIERASAIDQ